MYYVYVLQSTKDKNLYTGHTGNIEERLLRHNSGSVKSTACRRPFVLIHKEEFKTRPEARWRERKLKSAWGKKLLKRSLKIE
ncbi:MAG: GIY-YIG nuclease family protein [Candidatus Omnitrophica bacterium]|nr:GIY-YIG nuclease family protein [Candidatus Omnitrophota bacterium]